MSVAVQISKSKVDSLWHCVVKNCDVNIRHRCKSVHCILCVSYGILCYYDYFLFHDGLEQGSCSCNTYCLTGTYKENSDSHACMDYCQSSLKNYLKVMCQYITSCPISTSGKFDFVRDVMTTGFEKCVLIKVRLV